MTEDELEEWASEQDPRATCGYCRHPEANAVAVQLLQYCISRQVRRPISSIYRKVEEKTGAGLTDCTFRRHINRCLGDLHNRYKAIP